MPSSFRVLSCAALVLSSAACQTAEFEKTEPEAVVISLSAGVISADDGTLNVSVSAVQDGVALLEEDITVTIGGVCVAPPQTLPTGVGSGIAEFTFSGLDAAGTCTVTADARGVTSDASFTVVAGQPAALTLTDETSTNILAGSAVEYSTLVEDAAGNDISIGVNVTVDSDSATFYTDAVENTTHIEFTEAGDYTVTAQLFDLTATFDVTVAPAAATQVVTTLDKSALGQTQTLEVTCAQFDQYGNQRQFDFESTDVITNPAAGNIVEIGTSNVFEVSGFSTFGIYDVTCDDGALSDTETFNVGQQSGTNTVIATADLAQIEAGSGSLVVTCQEVDGFGNPVAFDFQSGTTFTTNAIANIVESPTNTFTISSVSGTGAFTATCTGSADSDGENFAVVDTTAPTIGTFNVTGTAPFAAGSTVTVNFDVIDAVGVAFESISIVSGPGEIVSSPIHFESGLADPPSRPFSVKVNGSANVSSTVVVRGQVSDTTGNLRTTSDLNITVDPAGTITSISLASSTVEAGAALTVTCNEVNAVTGSSANTNFATTNVTTTESTEIVTETSPNVFSITGHTAKGTFTTFCDGVSDDSDPSPFTVVDTTPPTVTSVTASGSAPYAAGTTVTVTVNGAADTVGLSYATLIVASGNATIVGPSTKALAGATSASPTFSVRLDGLTTGSDTVSLIAQVGDTTGNIREPSALSLGVNQAATAVVTTLVAASVEHTQTLDFACKQIHAGTGADTGATFAAGTEATTTATGASVTGLGSNVFRLSGFTAKGTFTATCTKSAQSDVESFVVVDTTSPTIGTLSVVAATGPNGVTADNRYAPGTVVTVRLNTTSDGLGLARVDLAATGPSNVSPGTRFVSGTTATNTDFDIHIAPNAATFTTIVATAQSADTTGNTSPSTGTLTLTVDPGAGLTVAAGVTLRTLYEGTFAAGGQPASLGTDGTDLFLQRNSVATGLITDVLRLTGSTAPASASSAITGGLPAQPGAGGVTAGSFGTGTIFQALVTQIGTNAGTNHATFDTGTAPAQAVDVALGDIGPGTRLFTMDINGGTGRILKSISTGATVVYSDPGEANLTNCRSLTKDAANARLFVACPNGDIRTITDTGADLGNASGIFMNIGANDAADIASTMTDTIVAGGSTGIVYRVLDTPISSDFWEPIGLAVKPTDSNSLHILDVDTTGEIWRVYRVTGY